MRGVARRLDDETAEVKSCRQAARRGNPLQNRSDQVVELGKEVHCSPNGKNAKEGVGRATAWRGKSYKTRV